MGTALALKREKEVRSSAALLTLHAHCLQQCLAPNGAYKFIGEGEEGWRISIG